MIASALAVVLVTDLVAQEPIPQDGPQSTLSAPVGAAVAADAAAGPGPDGKVDDGKVDDDKVDFASQIRPLLSDACFACHGPDAAHREADLRLDLAVGDAASPVGGAIVPGDLATSELWHRINSDDPDLVMPPPHTGKRLDDQAIDLIGRWIEQGADFAEHWAFVPPRKAELPDRAAWGEYHDWPSGTIDAWVLDAMLRQGLSPSPAADRQTLIRRVYLDLIGLPPEPEEVERFVADPSPNAYEQLVDRLLESVHHGERWGRVWLDAARYADSDGFEKDKPRSVWFYRDWVVRALNEDLPYDQFLIKQIAGDRLPGATQDDFVATGFLRNSMINEEGGVDPEQFRMEAMFDRMDAIGKSMLGLTVQCAQCHTHKYDPLSHEDYYALFALLNNCHEASRTVYTPEQQTKREAVLDRIDGLIRERLDADDDWLSRWEKWEVAIRQTRVSPWQPIELAFIPETIGGQKYLPQDDGSYLAAGYAPTKFNPTAEVTLATAEPITAVRLEMLSDPNLPLGGPGRSVDGTWALSEFELQVLRTADDGQQHWEKAAWSGAVATIDLPVTPLGPRYADKSDTPRTLGPIGLAIDGDPNTAWHGDAGPGRRNEPQTAMFVLAEPIPPSGDQPLRLRVALRQNHGGWNSDDNQTHNLGRFRVSVTNDPQPAIAPLPPRDLAELELPMERRSPQRTRELVRRFAEQDALLHDLIEPLEAAWRDHPEGTSQLVLLERERPRVTHRLERGDFLSPREAITPGVPAWLGGEVASADASDRLPERLDLARWVASPTNPLTARSIVNRFWQEYFGTGIVATSDDLGLQGDPPSHPELLDSLAADFMADGWSMKALHRQIVLSATYRQDSAVTPERLARDPENRWLSRGSRVRVPAETLRDLVLSAAGLLDRTVGGPPVYPLVPEFLFVPPASYGPKSWGPIEASGGYRRALYAFRFRSVPFPVLETFDAPNGDVACVRRSISSTPLQALVTLNEPVFVAAARGVARRVIPLAASNAGGDDAAIDQAFMRLISRLPEETERQVLRQLLHDQRKRYAEDPAAAAELAGHFAVADVENADGNGAAGGAEADQGENVTGERSGEEPTFDAAELAAWTLVCRVILNLDETVTRP
ncbi:MAG: DUF1553 domain-containing protein [Planctomycetaceae bacterium]|nr:MAG: DUF1553 domain-containing protein [Planctomycetaceae bacterium]